MVLPQITKVVIQSCATPQRKYENDYLKEPLWILAKRQQSVNPSDPQPWCPMKLAGDFYQSIKYPGFPPNPTMHSNVWRKAQQKGGSQSENRYRAIRSDIFGGFQLLNEERGQIPAFEQNEMFGVKQLWTQPSVFWTCPVCKQTPFRIQIHKVGFSSALEHFPIFSRISLVSQ